MQLRYLWAMRRLLSLLAACLCASLPAAARQEGTPAPLLLEDVLRRVDDAFPKLIGAEAARRAVSAKRRSKEGAFDPVVSAGVESLRYNSASNRGKVSTGTGNEIGIEVATPYGLKVAAGRILNSGSVKAPNSATGSEGSYFLSLKVPLARGAGINEKAAALDQARLDEPIAAQEVVALRQETLLEASLAYWEWVGSVRRLRLREAVLALAEDRLRFVQREVAEDIRPAIDAAEADAEVALRRADRVKAQRDVEKAGLKLRKYLWDAQGENLPVPDAALAPAEDPADVPAPIAPADADAARRRALELRPELAQLSLARRRIAVDIRLAHNDRRPNVDLVYAPGIDTGRRGVNDTLKAGVTVSIPLHQNDARGRLDEAREKDRKLEQEENLTRQGILIEIDDALSAIGRSAERHREARENLRLTRQVEEGERVRFREGDSTLFLLNQRERQSADAASRLIDIFVEFEQARSLFRAATLQR